MPVIAIASASDEEPRATAHEVGRRDEPVAVRDRPHANRREQHHRVDDDRVGHREEADRPEPEDERGNRHERVGRVDVAAEQEPGDPAAELAAAEPPLVEVLERLGLAPARGGEAEPADEHEERDDDRELELVDVAVHPLRPARLAVHERRDRDADRHPRELVPVEERDPDELRVRAGCRSTGSAVPRAGPGAASTTRDSSDPPPCAPYLPGADSARTSGGGALEQHAERVHAHKHGVEDMT